MSNGYLCKCLDRQAYVCYHSVMKSKKYEDENMQRTAFFLKPSQISRLQELSEETGAPVAELVRRAIDKYLEGRK